MRAPAAGPPALLLATLLAACLSPATGPGEEPDVPDGEAPRVLGPNWTLAQGGGVLMVGEARDNVGIVRIVAHYDDAVFEATFPGDTAAPFSFGPIARVEGPHQVSVEAFDAKGNRGHVSFTTRWNMPAAQILLGPGVEPVPGTLRGAFMVRGDTARLQIVARSRFGIERIQYKPDHTQIVHVDTRGDTLVTLPLEFWLRPGRNGIDLRIYSRSGEWEWVPFYVDRFGVRFRATAAGCAIATDDQVYCSGSGSLAPLPLPGGIRPKSIARGPGGPSYSPPGCVLVDDGSYYCWQESSIDRRVFRVPGSTALKSITAAGTQGCGIGAGDEAYCWEIYPHVTEPVAVPGGLRFRQLSAGVGYVCGVTLDDRGWCWGANGEGQLGTGDTDSRAAPAPVAGGLQLASIAAGTAHSCAVTTAGEAYCWGGTNPLGQLGGSGPSNSARRVTTPSPVAGGVTFQGVTVGSAHSCGLATDGRVLCWGDNARNQLGTNGTPGLSAPPLPVAGSMRYRSVSTAGDLTCALTTDDRVQCWGGSTRAPDFIIGQNEP